MRYKRIQDFAIHVIKPIVEHLKKMKKSRRMPWKELTAIMRILYPQTRDEHVGTGYFDHVFIVHTDKRWLALKVGRNAQDIRKDYVTYKNLKTSMSDKSLHRNFAKIYWASDIFMLQKWGDKRDVPINELKRLKAWGRRYGLKDIRPANIMLVDNRYKIVDAERI